MIEIQLNGLSHKLKVNTNIDSLLNSLSISKHKVAIELNKEVLPKENYSKTIIRNDDEIELVTFIGGG